MTSRRRGTPPSGSRSGWRRRPPATRGGGASASVRQSSAVTADGASDPPWCLHYLLQARDDPSLLVGADGVWRTRGRAMARLGRRFDRPQERLLVGLGHAARLFPAMAEDLMSRCPVGLTLATGDAYTFLRQAAHALESAGFGVLVPAW